MKWKYKVFFITFILACIFSLLSSLLINVNNFFLVSAVLLVIIIGNVFDIIGTAILSSDISVFNSLASQKVKGSKIAINLCKNSSSVSSLCNDVVGDVCGIISGSLLAFLIVNLFSENVNLYNILLTSVLSSITVGGKALGKGYAVKKSNEVILRVSKFLANFSRNNK